MLSSFRVKRFLFTVFLLSTYAALSLLFQATEHSGYVEETIQLEKYGSKDESGRKVGARFPSVSGLDKVQNGVTPGEEGLSMIFNDSCPTDYLGLTDYATDLCQGQSPEMCSLFSCRNFLTGIGSDLAYGHARLLMKKRPKKSVPDQSLKDLTSDCDHFKKTRGFQMEPANKEEQDFPIAFNILAHSGADQVVRLLRVLYRPQNVFCIHVDSKANPVFREALQSVASCFDNIRLASKSEKVVYAGYSRLQADINCMKDNLDSPIPWKYLINTAAQAYPLRSIGEMVRILRIYNGANDIEGLYGRDVIQQRIYQEWREVGNEVVRSGLAHPKPPHSIDIVRGSAYGVFSRGFVKFLLEDQRAIDLLNWSRNTFSPDEHYWASLHHTYSNPHLHTPGGYSGYPNNKTWVAVYANWDLETCRGKQVHGVCVFGLGDLPGLIERHELFANKFQADFEPLALDCLEAWLHHKDNCPVKLQEDFYRNLEFIRKPDT